MMTPSLTGIDIGSPLPSGSTTISSSRVDITAGGADIWETRDEFHFANTEVRGDFEVSVRVESLAMADAYTKAGLMLRTSLAAGSPHAMLLVFGDNQARNHNNGGLEFQSRLTLDQSCSGIYPPQPLPTEPDFPVNYPNVWLKLVRRGDKITGLSSSDGQEWKTFSVLEHAFPEKGFIGLAVTSHNPDQTVDAVFSQLIVSSPKD